MVTTVAAIKAAGCHVVARVAVAIGYKIKLAVARWEERLGITRHTRAALALGDTRTGSIRFFKDAGTFDTAAGRQVFDHARAIAVARWSLLAVSPAVIVDRVQALAAGIGGVKAKSVGLTAAVAPIPSAYFDVVGGIADLVTDCLQ